jgi:hypothetical protein
MLAPDHRHAGALAVRARAMRVAAGQVSAGGVRVVTETGAQTIGVGDLIETRRNHRGLRYGPGSAEHVRNHDRWHVIATNPLRGTLTVEHHRHHARLTLPGNYVAQHVRLGYATTIASAQGLTVDEAHVLVTPGTYKNELYVGLSRGRDANHAYAITRPDARPDHLQREPGAPATPREVLADVTGHERADWAAHSVLRRNFEHPERLDLLSQRSHEVTRLMENTPPGIEWDALAAYRDRLDDQAHEVLLRPPETPTPRALPELARAPVLEVDVGLDLGL